LGKRDWLARRRQYLGNGGRAQRCSRGAAYVAERGGGRASSRARKGVRAADGEAARVVGRYGAAGGLTVAPVDQGGIVRKLTGRVSVGKDGHDTAERCATRGADAWASGRHGRVGDIGDRRE